MERITRLDRVFVFGDRLSFLVPREWIEQLEEDNCYLYQRPKTDSGWLRVSLITSNVVQGTPAQKLKRLFAKRDNVRIDEETGNLVSSYEKDSDQNGVALHIYYWMVANTVLPDLIREAVFSYTILRERTSDEETIEAVKVIGQLVSQAQFLPFPAM
jgi:hypothetical protein